MQQQTDFLGVLVFVTSKHLGGYQNQINQLRDYWQH